MGYLFDSSSPNMFVVLSVEDYPSTLTELEARFRSEQACRDYLLKLRWPEGFVCPRCGTRSAWTTNRNLLVCAGCQYQGSLTAGTIFQDTRTGYAKTADAVVPGDLVGDHAEEWRQCAGPATDPGVGQLRDCVDLAAQVAPAMVRPGRDRLSGRVE